MSLFTSRNFFLVSFLFLSCIAGTANAQAGDTLSLAHSLTNQKQFAKAAALLARYEKNHPQDINAYRLHLQTLYYMGQLTEAGELYQRFMSKPSAYAGYLQLDYGRMLYESKQYPKAQAILVPLLQKEPTNIEALTMMGIMRYYESDLPTADRYLNKVLAIFPDNPTAKTFSQKIAAARRPYLNSYNSYRSDDQPLQLLENKMEAGSYRSYLLAPSLQAALIQTKDSVGGFRQHFQVMAGNKSSFLNQKLSVQLNAGIFKHASQNAPVFTGSAVLQYKLPQLITIEAAASRLPYLYTIGSTHTQVIYSQMYGALLLEKKGWLGRAQATEMFFAGSNQVMNLSAWVLSPAATPGPVYVKGGYSFGYADAKNNTYQPLLSTAQIVASGKPVAGTYGLYFTPEQQMVHSLLLNADAKAGNRCWISVRSSLGLYARAQNPYLFLNSIRSQYYIDKGFYTEKYTPYEVKGQITYSFSNHATLEAGYIRTRAFFYTANTVFANLKFVL